jgi:two-component system cell cycle response regulator
METTDKEVTILVADDSAVSRKLVEQALRDKFYSLLFAKNGQEAIELYAAHRPHIVIVDWEMPDITGIEFCKHIRTQRLASYAYIILLTGKTEKENTVAGLAAGADDYLTKPFHPEELIARVAVGIRISQLQHKVEAQNVLLQELALTDALTGLPNRRAIEDWAAQQLSAAARHGFSFCVVMADLDHFKIINDTYGHASGDAVLRAFAQILKTTSRRSDIFGRIGGEEFVCILTYSSMTNAEVVAQRIRRELETTSFVFDHKTVNVTASFGIASFDAKRPLDFGAFTCPGGQGFICGEKFGTEQGANRRSLIVSFGLSRSKVHKAPASAKLAPT